MFKSSGLDEVHCKVLEELGFPENSRECFVINAGFFFFLALNILCCFQWILDHFWIFFLIFSLNTDLFHNYSEVVYSPSPIKVNYKGLSELLYFTGLFNVSDIFWGMWIIDQDLEIIVIWRYMLLYKEYFIMAYFKLGFQLYLKILRNNIWPVYYVLFAMRCFGSIYVNFFYFKETSLVFIKYFALRYYLYYRNQKKILQQIYGI